MDLKIEIEGVDRTNLISKEGFSITKAKTSQVDTCNFTYKKYGSLTWTPQREHEIVITDEDTSTVLFGGRLVDIDLSLDVNGVVTFNVKCVDYTHDLNDELLAKTYENQTIHQIIDDFLPDGFTSINVDCDIVIERIQFNYTRKDDVMRDLAELVGYDWYVDELKDVHFFAKEDITAPFNINETGGNLIAGTLQVAKDNSGLKNAVIVKGGEYVGLERTEAFVADGEQTQFILANKFSELPTVLVDSVPQVVGVAYLNQIGDTFDCLWSFQEKYIDFGPTPLTVDSVISVTGLPLIPLIIKKNDRNSIRTYGIKEFLINDVTLKDPETAKKRAIAELQAYKDGIAEGSFLTYTDGLTAGQTIHITAASMGIDEDFIINSITMERFGNDKMIYSVDVVSQKTMGIIEFLQFLLRKPDKTIAVDKQESLTLIKEVMEERSVEENLRKNPFTIDWVWGYYYPTSSLDPKRMGRWDRNLEWA